MHHFCIGIAKTRQAQADIERRIAEFTSNHLIFKPDNLRFDVDNHGGFVFGASIGDKDYCVGPRYHLDESAGKYTVASGFPTFENYNRAPQKDMPIGRWLHHCLINHGSQHVYQNLGCGGGGWGAAWLDSRQRRMQAFNAPSGMGAIYYIDNPAFCVFGNKPSLLAAFQEIDAYAEVNKTFLLWPVAMNAALGYSSAWTSVFRVPLGKYVSFADGQLSLEYFSPHCFTPPESPEEEAQLLETGFQGIQKSLQWLAGLNLPFNVDLTGGKDSRAVLAAIMGAGLIDKINRIESRGGPEHGDRIIAEEIATALNLKNFQGVERPITQQEVCLNNQIFRFCNSAPHYDYIALSWDAEPAVNIKKYNPRYHVNGHTGELYREEVSLPEGETEFKDHYFLNWRCKKFDSIGWLTDDPRASLQSEILSITETYRQENTINMFGRFYSDNHQSNWVNSRGINNIFRFTPLANFYLVRVASGKEKPADSIHYKMIKRFYPALLKFRFFNQQWRGVDKEQAMLDGVLQEPLKIPLLNMSPWQKRLFDRDGHKMIGEIIDGFSPWKGRLVESKLHELRKAANGDMKNKNHMVNIFSLYSATAFLNGSIHGKKTMPFMRYCEDDRKTTYSGNSGEKLKVCVESRRLQTSLKLAHSKPKCGFFGSLFS